MNIINKYLDKKTKYIVDYSKKFNDIFSFNGLTLIKGKVELNQLLNLIVKNYVNKYWLNKDDTYILLGDFFDYNIGEEKEINRLLYEINEYYKNVLKIDTTDYKKDIYYLALLISSGIKVNSIFNSSSKNRKYRSELEELLYGIKKKNIIKFQIRKNRVEELIKLIKENIEDEERFFEYFNLDEIRNRYKKLETLPDHYYVKYEYFIDNSKYKPEYVNSIFKKEKINDLYLMISYELLITTILKESSFKESNSKYIIPITDTLSNNSQDVDKIYKIFFRKELREKVKFLLDERIVLKDPLIIKRLKEKEFNLCTMLNIDNKEIISEVEIIHENKANYLNNNVGYMSDAELINNIRREEE